MPKSDSKALLVELSERKFIAELDAGDLMISLEILEEMEQAGWRFKPPKTTNDTGAT